MLPISQIEPPPSGPDVDEIPVKMTPLHKASDLYGATQPGGPVAANEPYPGVAAIEVRWQKQTLGSGWQRYREPWQVIEPHRIGEFIDCPDPLCFGGGCCIGAVVRDMVLMKSNQRRGRVRCKGQKGADGKRRWRLCINVFKYEVRITYHEDLLEQTPSVPPEGAATPASGLQRRAG
jgi:hypothetical protein